MATLLSEPGDVNFLNRGICFLLEGVAPGEGQETKVAYQLCTEDGSPVHAVRVIDYRAGGVPIDYNHCLGAFFDVPKESGINSETHGLELRKMFIFKYGDVVYEDCEEVTPNLSQTAQFYVIGGILQSWDTIDDPIIPLTKRPQISYICCGHDDWLYYYPKSGYTLEVITDGTLHANISGIGEIPRILYIGSNSTFIYKTSLELNFNGGERVYKIFKKDCCCDQLKACLIGREPIGGFSALPVKCVDSEGLSFTFTEFCSYTGCGAYKTSLKDKKGKSTINLEYEFPSTHGMSEWIKEFLMGQYHCLIIKDSATGETQEFEVIIESSDFQTFKKREMTKFFITARLASNYVSF